MRIASLLSAGLTLALAACSSPPVLEPAELGETVNVSRFGDIYLSGQPSPEEFQMAADMGVETVVNIRMPQEQADWDERAHVESCGMEYVHHPWAGVEQLTDEVFDTYREILEDAEKPLLLHCGSANRVGGVWIVWRVLDGGLDYDAAYLEAKQIGLRNEAYAEKAKDYIARKRG
jgi:uncharacterized protein (TIGR01244 family)